MKSTWFHLQAKARLWEQDHGCGIPTCWSVASRAAAGRSTTAQPLPALADRRAELRPRWGERHKAGGPAAPSPLPWQRGASCNGGGGQLRAAMVRSECHTAFPPTPTPCPSFPHSPATIFSLLTLAPHSLPLYFYVFCFLLQLLYFVSLIPPEFIGSVQNVKCSLHSLQKDPKIGRFCWEWLSLSCKPCTVSERFCIIPATITFYQQMEIWL